MTAEPAAPDAGASGRDAGPWVPRLGARLVSGGVRFRVWAPARRTVELVLEPGPDGATRGPVPLVREPGGTFAAHVAGLGAGVRYRYRLDGGGPWPDPASRSQPEGVHGPSEVVDPAFPWTDAGWRGLETDGLVVYELHIGTFSPEGTFRGAIAKLPALRDLGVSAIEIMPVAAFPGARNWGYDGVAIFAPAGAYGRPEDFRALVDAAHALGLAVVLDVVYNHFGPDGAYQRLFSDAYYDPRHQTPWGEAIRLSGPESAPVREFFIENALHWIHEYHVDGLRLDATHAYPEPPDANDAADATAAAPTDPTDPADSAAHGRSPFTAALAAACRRYPRDGRHAWLAAEDHRNLARLARPAETGGDGLDAVWADDLHHELRRAAAGDRDGYYADFTGTTADIAATLRQGWFYTGQHSGVHDGPRGSNPLPLPYAAFVVCLQNHDQIGNRALGERLHHQIDPAVFRALTVLLLAAPEVPLLFMGQEWAAASPFLYFTDHEPGLGRLVTEGRRAEFQRFRAFSDPAARERIPDPQSRATFERSRLDWTERDREPHASQWRLTRAALRLRRSDPLLRRPRRGGFLAEAVDEDTIACWHTAPEDPAGAGDCLLVLVRLRAGRTAPVAAPEAAERPGPWQVVLTTEDAAFEPAPHPILLDAAPRPAAGFPRAGAVVWRYRAEGGAV